MCGIAGIYNSSKKVIEFEVSSMLEKIKHRGPDNTGVYTHNNLGLGHVRLSIIDLDPRSNQPMVSQCGRYIIVFNGEVYNFKEIRRKLKSLGINMRTNSDTEVVLEAFVLWKEKSFLHLNGMFSFCIFDDQKKELFLVRDRFGIKPLYFLKSENNIVFASEIKAILTYNPKKYSINKSVLQKFLWYGNSTNNQTMFEGIEKLPPAHFLKVDSNFTYNINSYWDFEDIPKNFENENENEKDVISNIRSLLKKAVERQLVADVPVGVFLSGGIDSSAITAFAAKQIPGLETYSVEFDFNRGGNSELELARLVAAKYGTKHHEIKIEGGDIKKIVELLAYQHDEPFADSANIPLYLLSQKVKGNLKVVLQGDGGDEIFGGYRRYKLLSYLRLMKVLSNFNKGIELIPFKGHLHQRIVRLLDIFNRPDDQVMGLLLTSENIKRSPSKFLSQDWKNHIKNISPFEDYTYWNNRFEKEDLLQKLLWTDCKNILPNTYLEKVDKSTMLNSLEVRVPFLDYELTSYVMGLPSKLKLKNGTKKYLLKKALEGLVPDKILYGRKRGFGVPYDYWLDTALNSFAKDVIFNGPVKDTGIFDLEAISKAFDEQKNSKYNNGYILWKIMIFSIWFDRYKNYII